MGAGAMMDLATQPAPMTSRPAEPTVRAIIESARSAPRPTRSRGVWITAGISGVLMWASFPPLDWGALGWIALVPLLLLVRPVERPRGTIVATYLCALISQVMILQWLRYGDPAMYLAIVALAFYLAFYVPVFVLLSRAAVHRFRVPFVLAIPTIWVGLDYFRAYLLTGCSWYCLGHTQYRWIELIQISDLVGAYGVSFVVATAAAAMALALPMSWITRLVGRPSAELVPEPKQFGVWKRRPVWAVAFSLCLVAATVAYGYVRRHQADFVAGPRVALVQGNFTAQVKHDPSEVTSIFNRHYELTGDAVRFQPDVIIWPETMLREPLLIRSPNLSDDDLHRLAPRLPAFLWKSSHLQVLMRDMSRQAGAAMIFGVEALVADDASFNRYNSAVLSLPDRGLAARYDKIHRVIFGEYIPLKEYLPFLRQFVPYGAGFGIDAGVQATAFDYKSWRLAPVICFEDTVPHLVRGMVASLEGPAGRGKPVDCLVNLTNDGWFHGSSGLDQHLIGALFRCVELRKPMVRAVNTGISAVIDGDGVVKEPEVFLDTDRKERVTMRDPSTGKWRRQLNAVLVDNVPLDNRNSLYLRYGDWFAGTCGAAVAVLMLASLVPHRWFAVRSRTSRMSTAASK
jgi:apolipoprotein N-acyltransferase